jgi:hypothetical protein
MSRTKFALSALAIVTSIAPFGAQAQDPKPGFVEQKFDRSELASSPFGFRLVEKAATLKALSKSYDWQDVSLTLNVKRAKSQRRQNDLPSLNFNRYWVIATDIGLVREISGRDSISASLSYALESHRPSFTIAVHNYYRTNDIAVNLGWVHDSKFRLNASLFATKPMTQRSTPERLVEIAGGAPLSAQGVSMTASFSPTHDPNALDCGVDITGQRIGHSDAALFGTTSGRSDAALFGTTSGRSDAALFGTTSGRSDARVALFLRKLF